jgi:hypothetical protein
MRVFSVGLRSSVPLKGPNGTRQRAWLEDHVKMQRPRTCGATAAGETMRRAMQQSPRHQTAMMARHFTVGRCADAPIPTLGLDASTLTVPFKCSLLDVLGTSPTSSSTTSSLDISLSDGSLCLLRRHRICELRGEMPRAPPGQPEQDDGSCPMDARSRRPPAHWGADAGRGEPRCPRDLHGLDPLGSCTRRCSERAVAGGSGDVGSPPRGEHRLGAPGGGGLSRPPPPGCRRPGAIGGGTPRDWSGRDSPPPGGGDAGIPHRAGVPILGAPRRRRGLELHHPLAAQCSSKGNLCPGFSVGEVVLVE